MTTDRHAELFANYRHLVVPAEPDEIEHLQRQICETRAVSLSGAAAQIEMVLLEQHSHLSETIAKGLENALTTIEGILGQATPHPDRKLLAALRRWERADRIEAWWQDRDDDRREAWTKKWKEALGDIANTPATTLPGCVVKAKFLVDEITEGNSIHGKTLALGLLADLQRIAGEAQT